MCSNLEDYRKVCSNPGGEVQSKQNWISFFFGSLSRRMNIPQFCSPAGSSGGFWNSMQTGDWVIDQDQVDAHIKQ